MTYARPVEVVGVARKGSGRKTVQYAANFPPDQWEEIQAFARFEQMTIAEAIRCLVQWGLEDAEEL